MFSIKKTFGITGLIFMIFITLFLSGCSTKPYLTKENSYNIIIFSPDGKNQEIPIVSPLNTNMAVLQKLLLEASFVLADLHTPGLSEIPTPSAKTGIRETVFLEAKFPATKKLNLIVDNQETEFEVQTIRVQVHGDNIGQVIINQSLVLQGIRNPNLEPTYQALVKFLNNYRYP